MTKNATERKCNSEEQLFIYETIYAHATVFAVAAQYDKRMTKSMVYKTMRKLIEDLEPVLSVNVKCKGRESNPLMHYLESVDLDEVVKFRPDEQLSEEYFNNLWPRSAGILAYDDTRPLWRLDVLNNDTVVVLCDHCVFDGMAGMLFHQKFAKAAVLDDDDDDTEIISVIRPYQGDMPLPPALEDLVNTKPSTWHVVKEALRGLIGEKLTRYKSWATSEHGVEPTESRTRIVALEQPKVDKLLTMSREMGVTLTGLLQSALTQAILKTEPEARGKLKLVSDIPVNARPYEGPQYKDLLACHVFLYHDAHKIDMNKAELSLNKVNQEWAKRFTREFKAVKGQYKGDSPVLSWSIGMAARTDMAKSCSGTTSRPRGSAVELSNLGAVTFPEDNPLQVKDLVFAQGANPMGALYTLSVAGLKNGQVNLVLGATKTRPLDEVFDSLQQILNGV